MVTNAELFSACSVRIQPNYEIRAANRRERGRCVCQRSCRNSPKTAAAEWTSTTRARALSPTLVKVFPSQNKYIQQSRAISFVNCRSQSRKWSPNPALVLIWRNPRDSLLPETEINVSLVFSERFHRKSAAVFRWPALTRDPLVISTGPGPQNTYIIVVSILPNSGRSCWPLLYI